MSKLAPEIIREFLKKTEMKSEQSVRNFVSKIKIKECPKATQNAAAQIAALIKGFSVAKKLKKEDKETLPANLSEIIERYKKKRIEVGKREYKKLIKKTFQNEIEQQAYQNAKIYLRLYVLENTLRKIIIQTLENEQDWWETCVPLKIKEYAKRIQEDERRYKWMNKRGETPLCYVTLEHLLKIILINWKKFEYIGDQEKFKVWIEELMPIRHLIAHNIKVKKNEEQQVELNVNKILRLIRT